MKANLSFLFVFSLGLGCFPVAIEGSLNGQEEKEGGGGVRGLSLSPKVC